MWPFCIIEHIDAQNTGDFEHSDMTYDVTCNQESIEDSKQDQWQP